MKCPSSHMNPSVNTLPARYRPLPPPTAFLSLTKPTDSAIRTRTDTAPSRDSSWEHESSSCRRHRPTIISPPYFISSGCFCVITHWRLSPSPLSRAPPPAVSLQPPRNPQRHGPPSAPPPRAPQPAPSS